MIPQAAITHWRNVAPWPQDAQVEQDLILCRALIEIFRDTDLSRRVILRGGTALYKLYAPAPLRYSDDIDLVQHAPEPIGSLLDGLRSRLDRILGTPRRENNPDNVTLRYRMESEIPPVVPLRLKIEINTREHFDVYGVVVRPLAVRSPWFNLASRPFNDDLRLCEPFPPFPQKQGHVAR
ncbi:MAG: nucleotidyl transferase AbiEii/AbiGii toxin family protein [Candidatus Tectomicrobia bacterium]|uniref:Nucleotidyl transferase AbiEii/AbiGii toxin family protein n=1 Tax=Tectimicrobiota bacterium TaxID=2528274 RepID=A0A932GS96_UNCTE|nr:nucleotidyl transferase AbiEii/AbiGii toxin family protein [Candidatus Tectomicrobia bacterium]